MKTILLAALFSVICISVHSQAWVWEKNISNYAGYSQANNADIVTDPNDNIIVLADNGSTTGQIKNQITKFTKNGELIWTRILSKPSSSVSSGSVDVDRNGNIYIYSAGLDSIDHVFTGVKNQGITKFSPSGNVLWHRNYYYTLQQPGPVNFYGTRVSLQVDDNDNVYISFFENTTLQSSYAVTLGNTTTTISNTVPSSPGSVISIGSLDAAGNTRWINLFRSQNQGLAGPLSVTGLKVAGNKLFLTGRAAKEFIYFDNGTLYFDKCTAWLGSFDASNGHTIFSLNHNLYVYCAGIACSCGTPYLSASTTTGRVTITDNINGGFVFRPQDTVASIKNIGDPQVKGYYTVYDTAGNPVKAHTMHDVPGTLLAGANNILLGTKGYSYFTRYTDTLKKFDSSFNLLWFSKFAANKIYVPKRTNDIIIISTRNNQTYLSKMIDSAGVISGRTYADWNNDGLYTTADSALSNVLVKTNASYMSISGNDSGKYYMYVAPGAYNLTADFNHPYYQFLPAAHTVTINQYADTVTRKDFRLRPMFNFTDVAVNLSSINNARPGGVAAYNVTVKNFSPAVTSADVGIKLPVLASYNSVTGGTVTVNSGDSITVSLGSLNPFQTRSARVSFNIATTATTADTLKYYCKAYPYTTDTIKANNIDSLKQNVRNSFDPNEKEVNFTHRPLIQSNKDLIYTVHFQNTGNDTAFYVRITDTLSQKLNTASLNIIDASHLVTTEIKGNVINFIFNPIILPDSTHNEGQSHGYVKYSIKPISSVGLTDTIYNRAGIYFDYNSAVITNQVKTWFTSDAVLPVILKSFVAQKNSSTVLLKFVTAAEPGFNNFVIERSADGINYHAIGTITARGTDVSGSNYNFEDMLPFNGINYYRLKMVDKDQRISYSWIAIAQFTDRDQQVKIFPNPANENIYINFGNITGTQTVFTCILVNNAGQTVWAQEINTALRNTWTINTANLASGIYIVSLKNDQATYKQKIIVKH